MKKTHFGFLVMFILIVMILFPLQKSYEVCTTSPNDLFPNPHLREQVIMPKIGFFTVGDDVPVNFTITNNYTDIKYLKVSEQFRPYQNADNSNLQPYDNDTVEISPNSTVSFNHSFVALFPNLWSLVVSAEGFDNSTREGIVNPCYQNFTKLYVHPSSDLYIKILAQSTNESAISAQKTAEAATNNVIQVENQGYILIATAIATAALAGFVFWQVRDQRRVSRLAYGPLIWPRFKPTGPLLIPILHFENIGNGAAINVNMELTLANGERRVFQRFAFSHHLSGAIDLVRTRAGGLGVESHNTGINLLENPRIPTRMTYRDINGDSYEISGIIIFENNQVRFERDT